MLCLAENKKIVLVGIPGVGKTSLLTMIVEILKSKNIQVKVISYGTLMFDIAKENGLQDRDGLRKLPISEQQNLQKTAAEKIATLTEDIVIIDTHAFITSTEGYYPGLPEYVLKIIKPSNFISVAAKPEEIYNRRMQDETRNRDNITLINIRKELEYQTGMISACAVITGTPVRHILNDEGKIDEAADKIISALGL